MLEQEGLSIVKVISEFDDLNRWMNTLAVQCVWIPNFIINCPKFTGILGIEWLRICDFNDPTSVPLPPPAGQTILFNSYCLDCHRTVNRNSKAGNATSLTSAGSPKQSTSLQAPSRDGWAPHRSSLLASQFSSRFWTQLSVCSFLPTGKWTDNKSVQYVVHSSPPGVHSSATGLSPCYLLLPAQESELTCPASPPMLSSPL